MDDKGGLSEGIIFFNAFNGLVRNVFTEDKEKYLILSWIIFNTNYQEQYKGLKRNQCFFSYSTIEKCCCIKRKKLQRIMKELEEDGFIEWILKSNSKGKESVLALKIGYGSEYSLGYGLGYGSNSINTGVEVAIDTVGDTVQDTVEDTLSKNISKNISNNIYSAKNDNYVDKKKENIKLIYDHWNSKGIIKHKNLTSVIEKAIEKSMNVYSTKDIVQAIDVYSEILKSRFYFNYKWSLNDFLNRKNGISTFMEEGSNKANYYEWKKGECKNGYTSKYITKDRGRFTEGTEKFEFKEASTNIRSYTEEEIARAGLK